MAESVVFPRIGEAVTDYQRSLHTICHPAYQRPKKQADDSLPEDWVPELQLAPQCLPGFQYLAGVNHYVLTIEKHPSTAETTGIVRGDHYHIRDRTGSILYSSLVVSTFASRGPLKKKQAFLAKICDRTGECILQGDIEKSLCLQRTVITSPLHNGQAMGDICVRSRLLLGKTVIRDPSERRVLEIKRRNLFGKFSLEIRNAASGDPVGRISLLLSPMSNTGAVTISGTDLLLTVELAVQYKAILLFSAVMSLHNASLMG